MILCYLCVKIEKGMKKSVLFLFIMALTVSCSHHTYTVKSKTGDAQNSQSADTPDNRVQVLPTMWGPIKINPNATAFRMSGNYSNNVGVTLSPDGVLTYFPAPTDITADSEPIDLGNGWWLNCQGLSPHSVFTKYTFAEYASLPEAPSAQQIKMDIIPGARVTQLIELPMKLNEALENLDEVKAYVAAQ